MKDDILERLRYAYDKAKFAHPKGATPTACYLGYDEVRAWEDYIVSKPHMQTWANVKEQIEQVFGVPIYRVSKPSHLHFSYP